MMLARFLLCIILVLLLLGSGTQGLRHARQHLPKRLFVFGDSYADTGNIWKGLASYWKSPYGSTFPGKPAGRFSDGRVITDFVATYLGVPSPVPYRLRRLAGNKRRFGINFAYGGTGVFDTNYPLPNMTTQIGLFQEEIKAGSYRPRQLRSSMALISLAGGDYVSYLNFHNGTLAGLRSFVHSVVDQIEVDLQRLVRLGVGRIGVTGLGPAGCSPMMTQNTSYTSCIDTFNQDAAYHNALLHKAVDAINAHHGRRSLVVVFDVFDTLQSLVRSSNKLRQANGNPLKPCCVGTAVGSFCGDTDQQGKPLYKVCADPGKAVYWDNNHPTQASWSRIFQSLRPTLQHLVS